MIFFQKNYFSKKNPPGAKPRNVGGNLRRTLRETEKSNNLNEKMHRLKYKIAIIFSVCILLNSCENKPDNKIVSNKIWNITQKSNDYRDYLKFIIQHPKSTHFDKALENYFKFREQHWDTLLPPPWHCSVNCGKIMVNRENNILFEFEPTDIDSLQKLSFELLYNINRNPSKPNSIKIIDPEGKEREISKGVFEITFSKSASNLQKIVIEVVEGLNDYKNMLAENWYKSNFKNLNQNKKDYIDSLFSHRLTFWEFEKIPIPPPPPPPPPDLSNDLNTEQ